MPSNNLKAVEKAISSSLRSFGYFKIDIDETHDDHIAIHADGTLRRIFLMVIIIKISTDPNYHISEKEIAKIKVKAKSEQREPWSAFVKIDNEGQVLTRIQWKDLSIV
jgi:GTPase